MVKVVSVCVCACVHARAYVCTVYVVCVCVYMYVCVCVLFNLIHEEIICNLKLFTIEPLNFHTNIFPLTHLKGMLARCCGGRYMYTCIYRNIANLNTVVLKLQSLCAAFILPIRRHTHHAIQLKFLGALICVYACACVYMNITQ